VNYLLVEPGDRSHQIPDGEIGFADVNNVKPYEEALLAASTSIKSNISA